MEEWTRSEFLTLEGLVIAFYTFLCGLLAIKVALSQNPTRQFPKRYAFYLWAIGVLGITSVFGVWMVIRPPFQTQASDKKPDPVQTNSCPCPEVAKTENPPKPAPRPSAASTTERPAATNSHEGAYIVANNVTYGRSPNALMGKFEGTRSEVPETHRFIFPNPFIRLAGDTPNYGDREITSVQLAIGDYQELVKIAKGKRGDAVWSQPVALRDVARYNGEEGSINQRIELLIPKQAVDNLRNKAMLIKLNNKYVRSGEDPFPGYILSDRNVFSGR